MDTFYLLSMRKSVNAYAGNSTKPDSAMLKYKLLPKLPAPIVRP